MTEKTRKAVERLKNKFSDYSSVQYLEDRFFLIKCHCGNQLKVDLNQLRDKICSTSEKFKIICCSRECYNMFAKKQVKIICLDTGKEYSSIEEAVKELGVIKQNLVQCLDRKRLTVNGLYFCRKEELDCSCSEKIKQLESSRNRFGKKKYTSRKIVCIETGEEFEGEYYAAKKYELSSYRVAEVCRTGGTAGGKHFMYKDDTSYRKMEEKPELRTIEFNLEKMLEECFEDNIYFKKMINIIRNPESSEIIEKHHIIPKSYFRRKKVKIINEGNLVPLSPNQHFIVHQLAAKCSKEIIRADMINAYLLMSNFNSCKEEDYEESKEKLIKLTGKKILCLEDGEVFNSIRELSSKRNIDRKTIKQVVEGNNITAAGKHYILFEKLKPEEREQRIKDLESRRKVVKIICLEDGEIYNSILEAEKKYGLNHSSIVKCINGKRISSKGLHFEKYNGEDYSEEDRKRKIDELESRRKKENADRSSISIECVETGKIYPSINQALKDMGLTSNGRFNKKLKKNNYIHGFHWKIIPTQNN